MYVVPVCFEKGEKHFHPRISNDIKIVAFINKNVANIIFIKSRLLRQSLDRAIVFFFFGLEKHYSTKSFREICRSKLGNSSTIFLSRSSLQRL